MGEAYIVRKGGSVPRDIVLISPPNKVDYYDYERADMTGTVIGVDFGTFSVPLHESAWTYEPSGLLLPSDNEIQITAVIGRHTKRISVPITVYALSPVLNENTWAQIAHASAEGKASQVWNVGDIKYETINGVTIGCRIIGFDADPLDETDAKYNVASYNGNKKKAGITFQYTVSPSTYYINRNGKNTGGWNSCDMRLTRMPYELSLCPTNGVDDMRDVMRKVVKYTSAGGYGDGKIVVPSADEMFLLAVQEVFGPVTKNGTIGSGEKKVTSQYAWYSSVQDVHKEANKTEWLRSSHDPEACSSQGDYGHIPEDQNSFDMFGRPSALYNYYPAFCV